MSFQDLPFGLLLGELVRHQHPDWDDEDVVREINRIIRENGEKEIARVARDMSIEAGWNTERFNDAFHTEQERWLRNKAREAFFAKHGVRIENVKDEDEVEERKAGGMKGLSRTFRSIRAVDGRAQIPGGAPIGERLRSFAGVEFDNFVHALGKEDEPYHTLERVHTHNWNPDEMPIATRRRVKHLEINFNMPRFDVNGFDNLEELTIQAWNASLKAFWNSDAWPDGALPKLRSLKLGHVQLDDPKLGTLPSLRSLSIRNTRIEVDLPPRLEHVVVEQNPPGQVVALPESVRNLTCLSIDDIQMPLPPKLETLTVVNVRPEFFAPGTIPPTVRHLTVSLVLPRYHGHGDEPFIHELDVADGTIPPSVETLELPQNMKGSIVVRGVRIALSSCMM